MRPVYIFINYSLIGALLFGLYFLWNENQSLKQTLLQVTNQLNNLDSKNQQLQNQNLKVESKLQNKTTSKRKVDEVKNVKNSTVKKNKTTPNQNKIMIVLPENENNYTKVIPKIDYKDIKLDKDPKELNDNNLKISPEVYIDKEEKKINGGKIQIETKF